MGNAKRRFRNLIINPQYQLKYIFWVTLSGAGLVLINAATFYLYIRENYSILVDLSPMTDEAKAQLYQELHEIMIKLGVGSILFLLFVSLIGLVISHRTAGPMFHFKRVFNEIRDGKSEARLRLRPNDDFQDVATAFNQMMDQVAGKK